MQKMHWQEIDEKYAYDGNLGLEFNQDGTITARLWAPSADQVDLLIFDKNDQDQLIFETKMDRISSGIWQTTLGLLSDKLTGLEGYFYQYRIQRQGQTFDVLDPYAKSMAIWDYSKGERTGKGAIINPQSYGPSLTYAHIPNYSHQLDAIIYELHVRDFTSDSSIAEELRSEFGTFSAFIEKLPYLKELGVTHIQLLPIMSYYLIDESDRQRVDDYSAFCQQYSWGYDPFNYFSISGVYSQTPENPEKRIEEFKCLINEIHQHGMGIILDVVFNHTGATHILEDIEPHYYYFEDDQGEPKEMFGGGSLGTTHYMSRKLVVDALTFWTEEYKVDGFRLDMMGSLDAETVKLAVEKAMAINPQLLVIGEGWRTYQGDSLQPSIKAADQDWMAETQIVSVFSDDYRDEVKSGHLSEGQPRFISGSPRNLSHLFDNICGQPRNFQTSSPVNVVQYFEAHDNLTLFDVMAIALKKDPQFHERELLQRVRLAHVLLLTSQGIIFLHGGQEYGRTKQFLHPDYDRLSQDAPYKSKVGMTDDDNPFAYPYFIHDSYRSSDAINRFEWEKVKNKDAYPDHVFTMEYVKQLIALRKSLPVFRSRNKEEIHQKIRLLRNGESDSVTTEDLIIGYSLKISEYESLYVVINADDQARIFNFDFNLETQDIMILVDPNQVNYQGINHPQGVEINQNCLEIQPLSACIFKKIMRSECKL